MPQKYQRALKKKATLHLSDTKNVDLAGMLQTLRNKYKVRTVACEGGPTLFRALLEQDLIDRLNLTIAPYMFGGAKAPTLTSVDKDFLPASVHCSLSDMRTIGEECFLTYRIKHQPRRRNWYLFATRSPQKFTFTVCTDEIHLPGATCAIGAFVAANVCDSARCKRGSAFFAFSFQLQSHFVLYSPRASLIVQRRKRSLNCSVFSV